MIRRLEERWKQLITARESPNFDENNTDSQEVLDDVVCRQLTREYLDVVKAVLTSGGGSDVKHDDSKLYSSTENLSSTTLNSNGNGKSSGSSNSGHNLSLSELGVLVLRDESLGQCIALTLLRALVWPDSPTSVRAAALTELIMPTLAASDQMSDADASQIMYTVLQAIHTLGQHEQNYIALVQLAIQTYELLRPRHRGVLDVLAQIPGCSDIFRGGAVA